MGTIIERTVDENGNVVKEEVIQKESEWMRLSEAAEELGVSVHTIHGYARKGILTKYGVDGVHSIWVKREEVRALRKPITPTGHPGE